MCIVMTSQKTKSSERKQNFIADISNSCTKYGQSSLESDDAGVRWNQCREMDRSGDCVMNMQYGGHRSISIAYGFLSSTEMVEEYIRMRL
jgi:hypothetical protein